MKIDPEIYRAAAESIASKHDRFACDAIAHCAYRVNPEKFGYNVDEIRRFESLFRPYDHASFWWGTVCLTEDQLARSLALLFMAEIAEDQK